MHEPGTLNLDDVTRRHYGQLLAWLAAGFRDVALAEDALQDALMSALTRWPVDGVPNNPQAWLMAAARRRILDHLRRRKVSEAFAADVRHSLRESEDVVTWSFPDERLKLMFVCAHPALDPAMHAPLMLQTVLGLDARRIADAFVVSPTAMSQRLVRVKAKIAASRLKFDIPEPEDLPERLGSVLDAIYAAYTRDWNANSDTSGTGMAVEALYLARLCVDLSQIQVAGHAEALGLLALIQFCEARSAARFQGGVYVPLDQQAVAAWDRDGIASAEATLMRASRHGELGRYQLEAAIQSAHVAARLRERDPSPIVLPLYRALVHLHPSLGAWTGYAAALIRSGDAEGAWAVLDSLPVERRRIYQPWWAVAAEVHGTLGQTEAALKAYDMAEGLADVAAIKTWLRRRRSALLS